MRNILKDRVGICDKKPGFEMTFIFFINVQSRSEKSRTMFFRSNVSRFTLSMVTVKIFIYHSKPGLLNSILAKFLKKTCPTFFCPRLYKSTS
jgi:hypothetical protein